MTPFVEQTAAAKRDPRSWLQWRKLDMFGGRLMWLRRHRLASRQSAFAAWRNVTRGVPAPPQYT